MPSSCRYAPYLARNVHDMTKAKGKRVGMRRT